VYSSIVIYDNKGHGMKSHIVWLSENFKNRAAWKIIQKWNQIRRGLEDYRSPEVFEL
jgi:hypothetical protein